MVVNTLLVNTITRKRVHELKRSDKKPPIRKLAMYRIPHDVAVNGSLWGPIKIMFVHTS